MGVDDYGGGRASSAPTAPGGRSAANPQKLLDYASAATEMIAVLRAKQAALHTALEALRPSASSSYVPSLEATDSQLDSLILDWEHLDVFVGDVGQGFADISDTDDNSSLVSATEAQLAGVAQIGFADAK